VAAGVGTNRESGVGTQRESGLVTRRESGLRDAAGVGSRDSPPAAKGQEGREEKWVVFQKKSVSWKVPLHRGGGPAESHREYYVGDAACEGGAGNRRTARSETAI
jgi:hypothetical protein